MSASASAFSETCLGCVFGFVVCCFCCFWSPGPTSSISRGLHEYAHRLMQYESSRFQRAATKYGGWERGKRLFQWLLSSITPGPCYYGHVSYTGGAAPHLGMRG